MDNNIPAPVPDFPSFQGISLGHKKTLAAVFAALGPANSEFCFGYLFSWRAPLGLEISAYGGRLIIRGALDGEGFIFPPISSSPRNAKPDSDAGLLQALLSANEGGPKSVDRIICADGDLAAAVTALAGDVFDVIPRPEYFDYVYRARDLAELSGDRYQSKRNFVNRFKKLHRYEYKLLDASGAVECLRLQKKWRSMKLYTAPPSILDEDAAAKELLENFGELGLCGCAIFVGSAIVAFSVGERLNESTLVMHLEKADVSYPGSYQMMSHLAAVTAVDMGYTYINKEEDLGLPNLRKAKMSYHPAYMAPKYEIRKKDRRCLHPSSAFT